MGKGPQQPLLDSGEILLDLCELGASGHRVFTEGLNFPLPIFGVSGVETDDVFNVKEASIGFVFNWEEDGPATD